MKLPSPFMWESEGNESRSKRFVNPRFGGKNRLQVLAAMTFGIAIIFCTSITYKLLHASEPTSEPHTIVVEKYIPPETDEVVVATRLIERGQPLDPADLKLVKLPRSSFTETAIQNMAQVTGYYSRTAIAAYQPISKDMLTTVRPASEVAMNIPSGHRAVTIRVDATSGVEGWARAGARVDIVWITDVRGEKTSSVIVQNAKVLSAEREVDPNAPPGVPIPTTVTLLASDRDAHKITFATTTGSIILQLRGYNDNGVVNASVGNLTFRDMVGAAKGEENPAYEGYARVKEKDGSVRQWTLSRGKLNTEVIK